MVRAAQPPVHQSELIRIIFDNTNLHASAFIAVRDRETALEKPVYRVTKVVISKAFRITTLEPSRYPPAARRPNIAQSTSHRGAFGVICPAPGCNAATPAQPPVRRFAMSPCMGLNRSIQKRETPVESTIWGSCIKRFSAAWRQLVTLGDRLRRLGSPLKRVTYGRSSHANRAATRVVARSAPSDFSYLSSRSPPFAWDVMVIGKYR